MLTATQRERIISHLRRGWKLPDSLVLELWEAYESLERNTPIQSRASAEDRRENDASYSPQRAQDNGHHRSF